MEERSDTVQEPARGFVWHPWITYGLIGLNVALFLGTAAGSHTLGEQSGEVLVAWGGGFPFAIWSERQYWRLFTEMFLHGSLWHVGMNMYSLYVLGPTVEAIYGRARLLYLYLAGGLGGSLLSLWFANPQQLSIGASGAVLATFGALLYFKVADPRGQHFAWRGFLLNLVMLVGIGVALPGVDNWAHLGGLAGGFVAAFLVGVRPPRNTDASPGRMSLWRIVLSTTAALALVAVLAGRIDVPGRNGAAFVAARMEDRIHK